MKKIKIVLIGVFAALALATVVPASASAQSSCTSRTYLHVDCATHSAFGWVSYDCCAVIRRENYIRHNANRVDIYVRAWRSGRHQCRWVIVRGDDLGKYSYYHPSYGWNGGCSGV